LHLAGCQRVVGILDILVHQILSYFLHLGQFALDFLYLLVGIVSL
jgi:hypothetical protein